MRSATESDILPDMEVASRIETLAGVLEGVATDGLLVTKLENIRYLTGFSGSAAMLFVRRGETLLVTDGRYREQASEQVGMSGVSLDIEIGSSAGQFAALQRFSNGLARIGLEGSTCTWALELRLAELFGNAELVATRGLVEGLRATKDCGEIARIERACAIADAALGETKARLNEGVSESEFAAELEFVMRRRGASGPAFETIVASGPNSAMPHARPSARKVSDGDLVVVDFGAIVDGYRSDMTRTFAVGEVAPDLLDLYAAVRSAQDFGVSAVSPGTRCEAVDAACRQALGDAGYGEVFLHSTGHGVGLEIHETPAVAGGSTDILRTGTVVTVEPGAYLPGRGGVRIEDTVVVTSTGARILTKSTKEYAL